MDNVTKYIHTKRGFLLVALALACSGGVHAQTGAAPLMPGWEQYVTSGPMQYNTGKNFNAVLTSRGSQANGQPFTLSNGYPPGSMLNSGILSTAVPQGGAVNLDLSGYKSWGPTWGRWFPWAYYPGIPIVIVSLAIVIGFRFAAQWLQSWGD